MAREHARILTSIWSDRDWRARSVLEQWLYVRVVSDKHINNAGVLPLWESRWARAAVDLDVDAVEKARRGLSEHRFLVVDEETDEALVRSFMRGDRVYRQPNVLKNALGEAATTESPILRSVLAEELLRIVPMLPTGKGFEGMPGEVARVAHLLDPEGSARTPYEGSGNPSANPSIEPHGNPSISARTNPTASRGVGEGVGEGGTSRPVGGRVGGSRARQTPDRPGSSASGGPPTPSSSDATSTPTPGSLPGFTEQPCGRRHSPDERCRRCGEAREARAADADRARRDAAAAVSACRMCDGDGRLLEVGRFLPVSPTAWCDHETDQRQQVADARDEAS
ncbi:hypothetical protein GCM10023201_41250 [Actinomycetospora corticicola]|uniref:Uncharacterized protein n=1 Tax=Actinomycetospora corticicola TaxID=663602 RepID=A0A7Y9J630_9PSEU|nr:hypothetical protein [Actinomycetospora corticicola]NYD36788.1 hypothetical protein [Actinomycetospora corticicola]